MSIVGEVDDAAPTSRVQRGLSWQRRARDASLLLYPLLGPPRIPPGRSLELPGRGTTFVAEVDGPPGALPIVLVHGLGTTALLNWFPALYPLSQCFHVVTMDNRGHGRGIPWAGPLRLEDCADDIAAMADVIGLDRFVVVGYSLGGPIAQLVWHRHRDRVAGMVLCATSRNFRGGVGPERLFYLTLPGMIAAGGVVGRLIRREGATAEELDGIEAGETGEGSVGRLPQWAIAELRTISPALTVRGIQAIGRFNSRDWIGDVDIPTAVVVTTQDRMVPAARQIKLAQAMSGSTIHYVHAGHTACVLSARAFVPTLVEACESVAQRLGA